MPGQSEANMNNTVIDQVKSTDTNYRREKEQLFIRHSNTFYSGLNRSPK